MNRRHLPGPALLWCLLWLVLAAGWRPLTLPDEGRYVGVAYEMLSSGDWLTPTLFGLPYFHKPPLLYWVDAAAMGLLGVNDWSARVAPLLGGCAMALALWFEAKRLWGSAAANDALALLATLPFFFIGAQFANLDMLVAGFITAAIVAARHALAATTAAGLRRAAMLASGAAALALLAKGLIGVVLPALVLAPWLWVQGRWRDGLRLLNPWGLALFLLLAAPWFVLMQLKHPGFLDYFFMEQHFRRYTGSSFNNPHPFWFYLAVIPLLALPSSLLLPTALRGAWRQGWRSEAGFAAWWAAAVVLFFSMPTSKLVGYVLPALPPLVLLIAPVVARQRWGRWWPRAAALVCMAALIGLVWKGPRDHRDLAQVLAAQLQPGDSVVYDGEPFFDLRMRAGLKTAPPVLKDWDDGDIARSDNWRKELADAARFTPDAGRQVLWRDADFERRLCQPGIVWLVVTAGAQPPPAALAGGDALLVKAGVHGQLWRLGDARQRSGCP